MTESSKTVCPYPALNAPSPTAQRRSPALRQLQTLPPVCNFPITPLQTRMPKAENRGTLACNIVSSPSPHSPLHGHFHLPFRTNLLRHLLGPRTRSRFWPRGRGRTDWVRQNLFSLCRRPSPRHLPPRSRRWRPRGRVHRKLEDSGMLLTR